MRVSGRFYIYVYVLIYVFKCVTAETVILPVHRAVFTTFKSGVRNKRKVDEALAFLSKKNKLFLFSLSETHHTVEPLCDSIRYSIHFASSEPKARHCTAFSNKDRQRSCSINTKTKKKRKIGGRLRLLSSRDTSQKKERQVVSQLRAKHRRECEPVCCPRMRPQQRSGMN